MTETFDLIIIGAGPAGYVAALRATQHRLKVLLVDKRPDLGGTCLNVGCIPSKALLHASGLYAMAKEQLSHYGCMLGDVELNLPAMMQHKAGAVERLRKGLQHLVRAKGVRFVCGTARVRAPGQVEVDGTVWTARHVLLAMGSEPIALDSLPCDGRRVITSDEAIALQEVPQRLVVVGAGAIGLELGSVWARLGSQVTVIEWAASIVPGMDGDIVAAAQRILAQQGLQFNFETQVKGALLAADGITVQAECGGKPISFQADVVLVAVGRRPCVHGLGLEDVGVSLDAKGRIVVDAQYQTTVPGLYAVGDLIPGPMLAHKAQEEALAFVDALCGRFAKVHYETLPNVVYTEPEIASVGLTQEQATAQGYQLAVGKAHFMANGRALASGAPDGMVKVLACAKTDRLLGVHVVGQHASELIGVAAVHMAYGGSAEDMARSVLAHPTLGEALREAAWAAGGQALHG